METELYDKTPSPTSITLTLKAESFLRNTAKWGKFMAIVGFVFTSLLVLSGLFSGLIMNGIFNENSAVGSFSSGFLTTFSFISVLYFIPLFYLYKFPSRMKEALDTRNNEMAAQSLGNLKSLFTFLGILTILVIGFYLLTILFTAFWLNGFRM